MPRTSARMHYKEFCVVVEVWWGMVVWGRGCDVAQSSVAARKSSVTFAKVQ